MRSCQLFFLAVLGLTLTTGVGCAASMNTQATVDSGAQSPIAQAMQQAPKADYAKTSDSPIEAAMKNAGGGAYRKISQ